jgi:3-oxoacyl-[acyl-carrier protein] reductase
LVRTSEASWDETLAVNLSSCAWLIQVAAADWGREGRGHAVLVGSHAGMAGRAGGAAYAASKAALVGLARCVARELGPQGILANVVVPPVMLGGMAGSASASFVQGALGASVAGRAGSAEECAMAICDLLGRTETSGQVLAFDSRPW